MGVEEYSESDDRQGGRGETGSCVLACVPSARRDSKCVGGDRRLDWDAFGGGKGRGGFRLCRWASGDGEKVEEALVRWFGF